MLVEGVPLLHPEPQVFDAMLQGWRNQMLARNLAASTVGNRLSQMRAFAEHNASYPWQWIHFIVVRYIVSQAGEHPQCIHIRFILSWLNTSYQRGGAFVPAL